jgi:hypothetical protein
MWIDLSNDYIMDENCVFASSARPSTQKMEGWSRYLIEVDLPVHHFKSVDDRRIEAVVIGKEEE